MHFLYTLCIYWYIIHIHIVYIMHITSYIFYVYYIYSVYVMGIATYVLLRMVIEGSELNKFRKWTGIL